MFIYNFKRNRVSERTKIANYKNRVELEVSNGDFMQLCVQMKWKFNKRYISSISDNWICVFMYLPFKLAVIGFLDFRHQSRYTVNLSA